MDAQSKFVAFVRLQLLSSAAFPLLIVLYSKSLLTNPNCLKIILLVSSLLYFPGAPSLSLPYLSTDSKLSSSPLIDRTLRGT